jgi:uncharacterized protein YyaL (SSP411 family)
MRPLYALMLPALLCVSSPDATAEEMRWLTDAGRAWSTAKQEKRPLLIYFTSSACHWCAEMKAKTFGHPDVAREINKSFVAVSLKAEDEQELAQALEVTGYPTTIIISPDKKLLGRMTGYVSPSVFRRRLAAAMPTKLH